MSFDRIPIPRSGGSLWLCALRDVADDPDAALGYTGASTLICLNQRGELERRAPSYLDWLQRNQPDRALWFPIRNFHAESADATTPLLQMVVDRLDRGVVMHCAMGQGRAGTMAVCVLMMLGASQADALHTVASHRAFAGPAESSQWALVEDIAREFDATGPSSD
jgi:protein-tyrosine phosphatase